MTASPSTLIQPKASASPGANKAAKTVPELPAPAIPSATPWYCGGYQRDASGSATAKDEPATPSTTPSARSWPKEWTPKYQDEIKPRMTIVWPISPVFFG